MRRKPVCSADISRLPAKGTEICFTADPDECEWLAAEHNVETVRSFAAEFRLQPWRKMGARLTGTVEADIVQNCVVTLEPVENRICERVDISFLPARERDHKRRNDGEEAFLVDPEGPDEPELLESNTIDIAAIAIEHFALGIDLYPRKPGITLPDAPESDSPGEAPKEAASPFAVLRDSSLKSTK